MAIIYKITNKVNGKIYIGETTVSLEQRWYEHCKDGYSGSHNKSVLHDAIHKYGKENFSIEQIDEVPDKDKFDAETKYILKYHSLVSQNGYNIVLHGSGYGLYNLDDFLKLWDAGYSQKEISEIIQCSPDTVRKFLYGVGITAFDFNSRAGKKAAQKSGLNKPIEQYSLTGEFIGCWSSASECARQNEQFTQSGIAQACRGQIYTYKGYLWKFQDDTTSIEDIVLRNKNKPQEYKKPKRIAQINTETNEIIAIYESAAQAAKALAVKHKTNLCLAARKGTISHGYYWRYIDD